MKKNLTNWIAILISLLPLIYLVFTWNSVPAIVPMHYGIDMQPDRMGNKTELWLVEAMMVTVSIGIYFLLKNLHRFDPKKKGASQTGTFHKIAFGLVVFLAALNTIIILSAKGHVLFKGLLFPFIGLLLAFIGNYMNNIKPNYFAGIRLPWTLNDDENWRKTHHLASKLWFGGGILIAIVSLLLPLRLALPFFIAVIIILVLIPGVYSYRLFKNKSNR